MFKGLHPSFIKNFHLIKRFNLKDILTNDKGLYILLQFLYFITKYYHFSKRYMICNFYFINSKTNTTIKLFRLDFVT